MTIVAWYRFMWSSVQILEALCTVTSWLLLTDICKGVFKASAFSIRSQSSISLRFWATSQLHASAAAGNMLVATKVTRVR